MLLALVILGGVFAGAPYRLDVPVGVPCRDYRAVLVLHGGGQDTAGLNDIRVIAGLAPARNATCTLLIYPRAGNDVQWELFDPWVTDVDRLRAVLDDVRARGYPIRPGIVAAGFSGGAIALLKIACRAQLGAFGIDRVVAVAGSLTADTLVTCDAPPPPGTVTLVHGVADPDVPFSGGAVPWGPPMAALWEVLEWLAGGAPLSYAIPSTAWGGTTAVRLRTGGATLYAIAGRCTGGGAVNQGSCPGGSREAACLAWLRAAGASVVECGGAGDARGDGRAVRWK
jgi:hypothetical protein